MPPFIRNINGAAIGIMPVIEDPEYLLAQLAEPAGYRATVEKMGRYRACEWLSVRLLLAQMLPSPKKIAYLPSGKPYITDGSYHISISHTRGYVAVIASRTHRVAIDIERISPRVERIKERFMADDELSALSTTRPLLHLLLHWSAKEAMFKILDQSEVEFKTHLRIHPFQPSEGEEAAFRATESRTGAGTHYIVRYKIEDQYVLTYIIVQ